MKLTNQNIWHMVIWLNKPMHGDDMRIRNEFFSVVSAQYQSLLDGRTEILEKFADKDKDGKPVIENETYKISPDKKSAYSTAIDSFMATEAEFPEDKKLGRKVVALLEKQNIDLGIDEGKKYLELLERLA